MRQTDVFAPGLAATSVPRTESNNANQTANLRGFSRQRFSLLIPSKFLAKIKSPISDFPFGEHIGE